MPRFGWTLGGSVLGSGFGRWLVRSTTNDTSSQSSSCLLQRLSAAEFIHTHAVLPSILASLDSRRIKSYRAKVEAGLWSFGITSDVKRHCIGLDFAMSWKPVLRRQADDNDFLGAGQSRSG